MTKQMSKKNSKSRRGGQLRRIKKVNFIPRKIQNPDEVVN